MIILPRYIGTIINHEIRIPINQPVFHGKYLRVFFRGSLGFSKMAMGWKTGAWNFGNLQSIRGMPFLGLTQEYSPAFVKGWGKTSIIRPAIKALFSGGKGGIGGGGTLRFPWDLEFFFLFWGTGRVWIFDPRKDTANWYLCLPFLP